MSESVAIAAPHHLAVTAAKKVLDVGGNVVEAVVAAAAAMTVVYPHQTSIGGDLFALVRRPDGSVLSVNASGAYGTNAAPPVDAVPLVGPLTVTVPGAVAGWQWLVEQGGGTLALSTILDPAIELAGEGVRVGERLGRAVADTYERGGLGDDGLRELLAASDGSPLRPGDTLRQPALAGTLRALADRGLRDFYEGGVAEHLRSAFDRLGVPVSAADLAAHQVVVQTPLVAQTPKLRVATSPPNSQGYLLLSTLLAIEDIESRGIKVDSGMLAKLFAFGEARRLRELADPRSMRIDVRDLLRPEAIAADVDQLLTGAQKAMTIPPAVKPSGDTVAITATASDGTSVSSIQSLFHSFGSRLRDPRTGIVLHNRGSFFSSDHTSPNFLAPGRRPAHTLMPVLAEYSDGTTSALGTMGGRAQPQILTQLIQRSSAGIGPSDAVAAPRFVVGGPESGTHNDVALAESDLGAGTIDDLRREGVAVRMTHSHDEELGHAMIAMRNADGRVSAGADPRSDGSTYVRP